MQRSGSFERRKPERPRLLAADLNHLESVTDPLPLHVQFHVRDLEEGLSHDQVHARLLVTTAGLLAGIGVATVIAHKVWPKGVLHGDHEDWEHPPSKHNRKQQQHRHRSPENAERLYERTTRRHGDVVYHQEISRKRPQNYERMPQEHIRIRQHAERLPYAPDDYYIQEQQSFYPTERRRTVAQHVPYPPDW
ncbi:hypothetical protein FLONG3_2682 [Fusarium longipes]|uniref:Uncharacterized protein n=1 Tax=Fusarium longipes TaxID=694270 RepID=A0A395T448_9HYPO|nr:hypothetical protein FLONG3_2682 [Fusarium longipes]